MYGHEFDPHGGLIPSHLQGPTKCVLRLDQGCFLIFALPCLFTHSTLPDQSITVFAGQDREATERARSYFAGNPPTSPAVAILRDGELVYLMQRFVIETSTAPQIAAELARAFDEFCAKANA